MSDLRVGSVVYLKSGGPAMTVVNLIADWALCEWDDGRGVAQSSFRPACLQTSAP